MKMPYEYDMTFYTSKKALIYSWLFSYLSHPKSHSVSSPSEIALQYVSYFRFTSILYIFVNILTSLEIREYSRAGPQSVWSLRLHPDSKHLPGLLLTLLVTHRAGPTDGPVTYILLHKTHDINHEPASQFSFQVAVSRSAKTVLTSNFKKCPLSTLLSHLGVNPNLLYNGSTSASMYLKRNNI